MRLLLVLLPMLVTCSPSGERVAGRLSEPRSETETEMEMGRVSVCERLRREYREDEWNAESDTYPKNIAWRRCMGVD